MNRRGGFRGVGGGAGAPAVADPSTLSGYTFDWWASGSGSRTLDGSNNIQLWTDETGTFVLNQGTAARRPAYEAAGFAGKPCVHFDSANTEWMADLTVALASGSWTIYFVGNVLSAAGGVDRMLIYGGATRRVYQTISTNNVGIYDGALRSWGAAAVGEQVVTYRMEVGVGSEGFRDGASIGAAGYTDTAWASSFYVGAIGGTSAYANLRLARLVGYNAAHSAAERAAFHDWSSSFYGVP